MHRIRIFIAFILFFISAHSFAQMNPWWIQNPAIDSSAIKSQAIADSVIICAKHFMGVPYVWGGSCPGSGFDCSGFVCYVYQQSGIYLPRTSAEQFNAGKPVPYTEAKPGDLILFSGRKGFAGDPGHVGIILSYDEKNGFTFIHTSTPGTGVHISTSKSPYYYKHFLEIRRVILPS